jgi:catechol 2,3-dioxygenase-like lactoylglutathione lyase family enzyme
MISPIKNRIGTVLIPVKNLQKSAEWYSRLLGIPMKEVNPPVYNLEMEGETGLALDTDNFQSTLRDGDVKPSPHPLFNLLTDDIDEAYRFLVENEVEVDPEIIRFGNVAFFHFKDPDGNMIMVYQNKNLEGK